MSDMDELVQFLRARLDEDEAIAEACGSPPWVDTLMGVQVSPDAIRDDAVAYGQLGHVASTIPGPLGAAYRAHIARHDPARVLHEVEAKRMILNEHLEIIGPGWCSTCNVPGDYKGSVHGCPTVRLLALPYADHKDYREEWRP
jgi:hypothetical protein